MLVDILAIFRGDKRCNDEINVAEEEEDDDGVRGFDRRVPVPAGTVAVEVDKGAGDEDVDDGKRVGDEAIAEWLVNLASIFPFIVRRKKKHLLENEVVSIACRWCKDSNHGNGPVLKQTGQGSVERTVAGEESRKGQNTLTAKLLDKTALGEDDTQDVAKGRQGDENGESSLGPLTKHVSEEGGGNKSLGFENLLLGHTGKIRNVGEHVQDGDGTNGQGSGNLESSGRVLGLAEGVVRVAVADETPDDVVERSDYTIGTAGSSLKGIVKTVDLLDLLDVGQGRDDDDDDNANLDDTQKVLKTQPPLQGSAVDQKGRGDTSHGNASLVPIRNLDSGGVENVLAKDDRVTGRPAQQDDIGGVHARHEEARLAVDVFQVVLLAAVLGEASAEFHVDCRAGPGDDAAGDPEEEGETNAARQGEDGTWGCEDSGADDSVEDKHRGGGDTDLALGLSSVFELS